MQERGKRKHHLHTVVMKVVYGYVKRIAKIALLNRYRLRQITWLVNVGAFD